MMGESRSWSWEVPAFEGRSSSAAAVDEDEDDNLLLTTTSTSNRSNQIANTLHVSVNSLLSRRLSLPAQLPKREQQQQLPSDIANKLVKLRELLVTTRGEFLDIRQEASDLQEYSNAKLTRVTRYLGVLADKTRKLDRITTDYEHRLALVRKEKSLHFNELISSKGNVRVVVRARPPLANETITEMSFPDEFTVYINTRAGDKPSSKALPVEYRFDQVFEPRVSQGEFFQEIQPLVQSALDGYNVSILACGAKNSGKTYTLEGPSHDRGVYFRAFEELFDLSNGESTPQSRFKFFVTMLQLCSDKVEDLLVDVLSDEEASADVIQLGSITAVRREVANPSDFARTFKAGLQNQLPSGSDLSSSCLIVTIHVHFSNACTMEEQYSKISLVDVPGSEESMSAEGVSSSFLSLVEVISAVVSRRDQIQYKKSKISRVLSDSIGGDTKTLIILNISPSDSDVAATKSWLKVARLCHDTSRSLQNKIYEEQNRELKLEVEKLKKSLRASEDQFAALFLEIQKSGKADELPSERSKLERDQIVHLKTQVAQLAKYDRDQKAELANRASKILALEDKLRELSQQLEEARANNQNQFTKPLRTVSDLNGVASAANLEQENKFGEELAKRDELIERLHEENEKLFQRLTERGTFSPKIRQPEPPPVENFNLSGSTKDSVPKRPASPAVSKDANNKRLEPSMSNALQKTNSKSTPAGEYLTTALSEFDVDIYQSSAAVADAANKLLMLVLAAVIKAGAAREHDMLEEIRGAVFAFTRKLEPRKVMDTMLVSRVRILYVRSLLARSPELQTIKVPSIDKFLEKAGPKSGRTSSSGSSPTRSPLSSQIPSSFKKDLLDEQVTPFRVNLKPEKASKLSSIVLKLRGIDQETWRQHLTGAKLREMNEEARNYAIGNRKLAALFVHTPAGELQRQIRNWLAENFDFLSLTISSPSLSTSNRSNSNNNSSGAAVSGGAPGGGALGQLDLLSTAIMDGWMAGLGIPVRPTTDALGHLLSDYTKHVYLSQLQNLKDVAATMATEEADDIMQINKIRTALEAVDHKRRKILQQMRSDPALLTKEEGGSPLRCPSTASEEARIASLVSLESICSQAEEIRKEAPGKATRFKFFISRLESLTEQTSALLSIDHPCANRFIRSARRAVEAAAAPPDQSGRARRASSDNTGELSSSSDDWSNENPALAASEIVQWSVLQFNTGGSETPFIIKCGATSSMQLVIKAQSRAESGKEVVAIVPSPESLIGLSLEEIKQALRNLPESFTKLAMSKTSDGTRARYSRLYRTLAARVPALRNSVSDVESSGVPASMRHSRRASESDNFLTDY